MCDGTPCPCNLLDENGEPRAIGPGPLTRFRDWWHRPVLDRLDAIERNTRPTSVTVRDPQIRVQIGDGPDAVGEAVRRLVHGPRPSRSDVATHGVCDWCERTVEVVHDNGRAYLGHHLDSSSGRDCLGYGDEDFTAAASTGVDGDAHVT